MVKKKKRFILYFVLAFTVLLIVGAVVVWFNPLFGSPLPKFESFSTPVKSNPTATDQVAIDSNQENETEEPPLVPKNQLTITSGTEEESVNSAGKAVCGGPDSMSVLVLGVDKVSQADAIRLVRIDFIQKSVTMIAIPRDFYLPIVDMADHGIEIGRINATYGYGEYYNGRGMGIVSIAENLNYNYNVTFDHYIVMNFDNFAKYIDIIGGVDIYLENPVNGTIQNLGYYSQGDHHLDGESAIDFMRIRYIDSDFYRVRRQNQVLMAIYDKVKNDINLGKIINIGFAFVSDPSVQSDFAVKNVMPLLCLAKLLTPEDIQFIEIPQEMYQGIKTASGAAVKIPDDRVVELIQSIMSGNYQ